jgi:hypothetical protein
VTDVVVSVHEDPPNLVLVQDATRVIVQVVDPDSIQVVSVAQQGPPGPQGPPGGGGAESITGTAGAILSGHRLVALALDGRFTYATGPDAVGLTLGAALAGESISIQASGMVEESSWNWTPSAPIYQTGAGQLTQTLPTTGLLRQVAVAMTATQIILDLQPPTILI